MPLRPCVYITREQFSIVSLSFVFNSFSDSDEVLQVIYIGQPVVENHDGNGIAASIKSGLDLFKIHPTQIEGASFDGQYFHLSVPQHLASQYGLNASTFISTWDPMHRAGLVDAAIRKDETFCWLITVQMTCQSIFKRFNWGKNYELLVKACKILDTPMQVLKTLARHALRTMPVVFLSI